MEQKITKEMTIQAPVAAVWDALVNPELIKQYLYGTDTISDWKEGSSIKFTGSWEGKEYEDHGTILKLVPEKVFSYTYWSSFSGIPDIPENYTHITFELSATPGGGTLLTLTQEHFPTTTMYEHSSSDEGWFTVMKGMKSLLEK